MRPQALTRLSVVFAIFLCAVIALTPGALATHGGDREVTVDSEDTIFSQNKQNEPAITVDPTDGAVASEDIAARQIQPPCR